MRHNIYWTQLLETCGKIALVVGLATCEVDRDRPRTSIAENDGLTTEGATPATYVADLAIDPVTGKADFINLVPLDTLRVRENMKQLLDIMMGYFSQEMTKVDSGELAVMDQLLYDQELNYGSEHNIRPLPSQFNHRRA